MLHAPAQQKTAGDCSPAAFASIIQPNEPLRSLQLGADAQEEQAAEARYRISRARQIGHGVGQVVDAAIDRAVLEDVVVERQAVDEIGRRKACVTEFGRDPFDLDRRRHSGAVNILNVIPDGELAAPQVDIGGARKLRDAQLVQRRVDQRRIVWIEEAIDLFGPVACQADVDLILADIETVIDRGIDA